MDPHIKCTSHKQYSNSSKSWTPRTKGNQDKFFVIERLKQMIAQKERELEAKKRALSISQTKQVANNDDQSTQMSAKTNEHVRKRQDIKPNSRTVRRKLSKRILQTQTQLRSCKSSTEKIQVIQDYTLWLPLFSSKLSDLYVFSTSICVFFWGGSFRLTKQKNL